VSGSQKVQRAHLERRAIVYLRQSSPRQVRENFRSTERQYGLAGQAAQLGWEPARILTVDADLGISGRGTHAREAYKELVGRVCLGEVGAIFGLEVARLARNNAELLRLLEFCAVTDTLVVDTDGIYDLKDFNDRTILGLKAQWSEAELHIMASRLQGAKRHAAERGELRLPLPIGYVYDAEGAAIIDPDEEVQAAVSDLFKAFAQTGSAYGVVGVFKDRRFPKRVDGVWAGELRWERLRYSRVRQALTNPAYAGAYAFGRHSSRRAVTPDGTIVTKKAALPRAEWAVLIHDHHPAYISWDAFLANEARLAANHTCKGERPPREGGAICQGIVRCGSCGRTMGTHYQRGTVSYKCARSRLEHLSTPGCSEIKADVVDELLARRLLQALAPMEIALALAATDEVQERRARASRALELRAERARYEAIRAERAFHACEPDNRLVARTLETRWETKLRELRDAEAELAEQATPAPEPSREQVEALAHDLPALWAAKSTSDKDRKRLLRAFVNDVTLTFKPQSDELSVGIRWRSGASERHTVKRPERDCIPPATLELIARLAADHSDAETAAELQAADLRTPRGRQFNGDSVKSVRHRYKIPLGPFHRDGELRPPAIAKRLAVSESTIYDWIHRGTLRARRGPGGRLWVQFGSDVEQECRERIANSGHITAKTKERCKGGAV
jgi:excisionase family DNA binding protein